MTKAQVAQLLTVIAAFDRRTIGEADVEAWHLILVDLEVEDCLEAVKAHFSTQREWLMPADVRTRAKATARKREGLRRRTEIERQIAAENQGQILQRGTAAIVSKAVVGRSIPADDEVRAERRRMLQAAAHAKKVDAEAEAASLNAERVRLEQARAELDALRDAAPRTAP